MNRRFIVRDHAQIDIDEAEAYYESVRVGLGETYLQEVQATFERIEWMPEMYAIIALDVRAARVKRFRYIVHFVLFDDRIEVIAVVHGARDSSVWESRI